MLCQIVIRTCLQTIQVYQKKDVKEIESVLIGAYAIGLLMISYQFALVKIRLNASFSLEKKPLIELNITCDINRI